MEDMKQSFQKSIREVGRQVHRDMSWSIPALKIINNMIDEMVFYLTSNTKNFEEALQLFPSELRKHALNESLRITDRIKRGEVHSTFNTYPFSNKIMDLYTIKYWKCEDGYRLAAIVEYICAELLELGGNIAKGRYNLKYIKIAINNDEELEKIIPQFFKFQ